MEYHYSNSKDEEMETQICYLMPSAHIAIKWWSQLFKKNPIQIQTVLSLKPTSFVLCWATSLKHEKLNGNTRDE